MATDYISAVDSILSALKVRWDADTPAITGTTAPTFVYEDVEPDLKPHPRDTGAPWARVVVRHNTASKVTLNNEVGTARYRRMGLAWVQVFVPATMSSHRELCLRLAQVAQDAYEGTRAGSVVFTSASLKDQPRNGNWFQYDVKAEFYWDAIK